MSNSTATEQYETATSRVEAAQAEHTAQIRMIVDTQTAQHLLRPSILPPNLAMTSEQLRRLSAIYDRVNNTTFIDEFNDAGTATVEPIYREPPPEVYIGVFAGRSIKLTLDNIQPDLTPAELYKISRLSMIGGNVVAYVIKHGLLRHFSGEDLYARA